MCGPSRNRKQEYAIKKQNRLLEDQRIQAEKQLAEQRRVEAERTGKINQNVSSIDQAFAGFDDEFYGKASQNVLDYYTPQLQDQFTEAQKKQAFKLADQGLSDSSVAGEKAADLKTLFDRELTNISSKAEGASNAARADVSNRTSNLRRMAEAGNGLDNFNSFLTPEVSQVNLPTNFSSLGDVFGSVAGNINTLQQSGLIPTYVNDGKQSGANSGSAARVIK